MFFSRYINITSYITPPPPYFIVLASSVTIMEVKAAEFHRICVIITFSRIMFPVELRRWDSNKPTLIQLRVFFKSAPSRLIKM